MSIKSNGKFLLAALTAAMAVTASAPVARASDHDDGVSRLKTRNRNLTDLYVFREDNQSGVAADAGNLILVMNSDPRAPAGRQEFFSSSVTYDFHVTQVAAADKNRAPTGADDLILRFMFFGPDASGHQSISLKTVRGGVEESAGLVSGMSGKTTTLAESKANTPTINMFKVGDGQVAVFAGLREDPFFFDVDQFIKVRVGALGKGPKVGFRPAPQAVDFTTGLNVNSIVVRIPIALLQTGSAAAPIFDIWETVTLDGKQIERLARPAINEGLIESNGFLNAFNMIPPSADMSAAAAPVRAQAAKTLLAFDMIDGKIDIPVEKVVGAFLPDVMRIDSRVAIPVGTTAYNADLSGDKGMLTGGRKLQDDVMDITLSLLVAGDATGKAVTDNVSYEGVQGSLKQGHKALNGQAKGGGAASFPFLALPN